jgi:hypothetical protein
MKRPDLLTVRSTGAGRIDVPPGGTGSRVRSSGVTITDPVVVGPGSTVEV